MLYFILDRGGKDLCWSARIPRRMRASPSRRRRFRTIKLAERGQVSVGIPNSATDEASAAGERDHHGGIMAESGQVSVELPTSATDGTSAAGERDHHGGLMAKRSQVSVGLPTAATDGASAAGEREHHSE